METVMPDGCRNPSTTTRTNRTSRFRKALPSSTWPSETLTHLRENASNYARNFSSDHNMKSPEDKSSDESGDVDTETRYPNYASETKTQGLRNLNYKTNKDLGIPLPHRDNYEDASGIPSHRVVQGALQRYPQPRHDSVEEVSTPGTMAAEQKLRWLKELQRRRELTERYYSQEIRKLITEYYKSSFAAKNSAGDVAVDRKLDKGAGQQQLCTVATVVPDDCSHPQTSGHKALEPCGTMTTITRLDCGCTQETTRPIFTTPNGRVENRNCRHSQSPALLQLTPSNPREHLSSSNTETGKAALVQTSSGLRQQLPFRTLTPGQMVTSSKRRQELTSKTRCTSGQGRSALGSAGAMKAELRRTGTVSSSFLRNDQTTRNLSPLRKYSDSSTE